MRRPRVSRGRTAALAAVSVLVVVVLTLLVVNRWAPLIDLDLRIDTALHDWALGTPAAVAAARFLDVVGDTPVSSAAATVVALVLVGVRRWRLALAVALIASLAPLITHVMKGYVGRPRPVWPDPFDELVQASFPSGHATGGIAVWLVCGLALSTLLRRRRWLVWAPFALLGVAIGVSRTVLGLHWPSDVVAGWAVALTVVGLVVTALARRPATATAPASGD